MYAMCEIDNSSRPSGRFFYPPSFFELRLCWLLSLTRITYLCKLIGISSFAALTHLELFWGMRTV
ncbi:hypothetical protein EDF88_0695 [Buttiauxella sp. BIGb0552]|nr:hypothetical protein EDF88_0695 [Buttiauxella sp. BIGb0552]